MNRAKVATSRSPRAIALAVTAGAAAALSSAPAFGLAEAIQTICPSGFTGVSCPWYEGAGPVFTQFFDVPIFTGDRCIVGVISGLFPLSSHEALVDDFNDSRVLLEISASTLNSGDGDPDNQFHVNLRTNATGILHAAMGNGLPRDPDPLARGVAFTADAYAAAVAISVSPTGLYAPNLPGLASALLTMTHEPTAASFGISRTADVVVTDLQLVGDYEAEGYLSRSHDAIAYMTGVTIVAGTGDGAAATFPPDQQDLQFRTIGMPAGAYNTLGVGAFATPDMTEDTRYIQAANFSGRGRLDARNWRSFNPQEPSGFDVEEDSRFGVDVGAPGMKLRLATAEGEGAYSRDIEFPVPNPNPLPGDDIVEGSRGTRFAAGIVAGGVALLQDGYKALLETEDPAFDHWIRPRLPFYAVRALIVNSAARTTQWTNQGNQGEGGGNDIEELTQQPLDTVEGGGQIDLNKLHQSFQGKAGDFQSPAQPATMDHPFTRVNIPIVRLPPSIFSERAAGGDPDLGNIGGIDPPLGGGGLPPGVPTGPFIPDPFLRPRPQNPMLPQPPDTDFITPAISVRSIGWDIGNVGNGWIDYAILDPLNAEGTLTATLVWPRRHIISIPNVAAGQPLVIPAAETTLELEDLTLLIYQSDGSGNARRLVAESRTGWNVLEHVVLQSPPIEGEYLMRVQWEIRRYDLYNNNFIAAQEFALAWRFDVQGADDAPPLFTGPAGDLNFDGVVTMEDVNLVLQAFGSTNSAADVNGDGVVNFFDLNIVLSSVQTSQQNDDDFGDL
ncbi:MAG: S8 family serine peptidase [Phycisphaerales bacterium]|nr:S8 family serine peptidase [Phycisphaerales bacterium]